MNDADSYIEAVADACRAAGLFVSDWWTDDIDPRDGGIDLVLVPDADPEEDYGKARFLGWDEQKGWFYGRPKDPHGELTGILYFPLGPLPAPAEIAEAARRLMAGEVSGDERRSMIRRVHWRDQDADDGFNEQLAAYRNKTAPTARGREGRGDG